MSKTTLQPTARTAELWKFLQRTGDAVVAAERRAERAVAHAEAEHARACAELAKHLRDELGLPLANQHSLDPQPGIVVGDNYIQILGKTDRQPLIWVSKVVGSIAVESE